MLSAARIELLEPRTQKPSYRYLLNVGVAVIQNALNEATHTHRAWAVGDTTLSLVSGVDEYQIGAASVGKVLDVVNIVNPTAESYNEYQVPFVDLTDLPGGYDSWGGWADWGYSGSQRIAFYRKDGFGPLYARVRPIPQTSMDYRLSFTIGSWADGAALTDEPFLSAHHHYFTCCIARDSIAACEWSDDPKADDYKRQSLERSLNRRIDQDYRPQFKLEIVGLSIPRVTSRDEAFPIG